MVGDRERESVGLAIAVIGILAEDNNLDFVYWETVESIENEFRWRINGGDLVLVSHEISQGFEILFFKLVFE